MVASVVYKSLPLYVANAPGESKKAVIVIQEWWGLNKHMESITARLAKTLNATAVCPDLYKGKVAETVNEANHLFSSLDWPKAIEDIGIAVEYLTSQGNDSIGVVGFCMGGALTIASCVKIPGIKAGVCFYGIPSTELANPAKLTVPMQFHFADKDKSEGFADIKVFAPLTL